MKEENLEQKLDGMKIFGETNLLTRTMHTDLIF